MVRVSRFSLLLAVFSFLTAFTALYAQGGADDVKHKFAPINTAIPSLSIAPDARGGAMGDNGVATTPDVNSQYWNPAKYAFSYSKAGVALSYTPWLRKLVNDVALAYLAGYYKLGDSDMQAIGASIPPDMIVGSVLGTAFAITTGKGMETAITIAMPAAILSAFVVNLFYGVITPIMAKAADRLPRKVV